MPPLLIWLAMALGPSLLVLLWIKADEWLACETEDEAELESPAELNITAFGRLGREALR